jgi:hypothetical protein
VSAQGTWNVVIDTPMGKQAATLELSLDGDRLTGTSSAMGTTLPIENGTADGDKITFTVNVTTPMKLTLVFDLAVTGDELSGKVKAGMFGNSNVTGTRAARDAGHL